MNTVTIERVKITVNTLPLVRAMYPVHTSRQVRAIQKGLEKISRPSFIAADSVVAPLVVVPLDEARYPQGSDFVLWSRSGRLAVVVSQQDNPL